MATRALEIRDNRIAYLRKNAPKDPELEMHPDNVTGDWVIHLLHDVYKNGGKDPAVTAAHLGLEQAPCQPPWAK